MSYKKWILGIVIITITILIVTIILNYTMDIYNYWHAGEEVAFLTDTHTRILKMKHISLNPDKYYGYIIGGSKAGALDADLISEYEGQKFYNLSVPWGCFEDYKEYIKYIADNTSAKKIILHLSSIEVVQYSREKMPSIITESKLDDYKEKMNFLIINPAQVIRDIISKKSYDFINGGRNYEKELAEIVQKGDKYFEEAVLTDYDNLLDIIFHEVAYMPAHIENVEALRSIIEICKANEIELQVVIGPTFITELYKFEGDEYWSYLREIASMVNFWDFSGFNDVNRNPYNFINFQHYNYETGNKMIDIMYGKDLMEGFGIYVDPNNFNDYISQRTSKYFEMQKEFEETGTIQVFNKEHKSYIK